MENLDNYIMKITHKPRSDGFGSHFKTIIFTIIYCKFTNNCYIYRPLKNVAHNYENDPLFCKKLENLMNIESHYPSLNDHSNAKLINGKDIIKIIQKNPKLLSNENIEFIRNMYYENKDSCYNNDKFNIALHIRNVTQSTIMCNKYIRKSKTFESIN